jgi:hypothetical protein
MSDTNSVFRHRSKWHNVEKYHRPEGCSTSYAIRESGPGTLERNSYQIFVQYRIHTKNSIEVLSQDPGPMNLGSKKSVEKLQKMKGVFSDINTVINRQNKKRSLM